MSEPEKPHRRNWNGRRLTRVAVVILILCGISLLFYGLLTGIGGDRQGTTISISLLFGLPFCIGALGLFLLRQFDPEPRDTIMWSSVLVLIVVFGIGAVVLREAIICALMAFPFWLVSGSAGVAAMRFILKRDKDQLRKNCAAIFLLPYAMLGVEMQIDQHAQTYTVSRSIIIEAPARKIRPLFYEMPDILPSEGRWTITQGLLGVPRPASAVVQSGEDGALRRAEWEHGVNFEEHIFLETEREMRWRFVFPNDSVSRYTDRHISVDGPHLRINTGGYRIEAMPGHKSRLTLDTTYTASTPVNTYASLWGELILGDIQSNVLAVIKGRAEDEDRAN